MSSVNFYGLPQSGDRRSEITQLLYYSCRQEHTYIDIKLYIHAYIE